MNLLESFVLDKRPEAILLLGDILRGAPDEDNYPSVSGDLNTTSPQLRRGAFFFLPLFAFSGFFSRFPSSTIAAKSASLTSLGIS